MYTMWSVKQGVVNPIENHMVYIMNQYRQGTKYEQELQATEPARVT